MEDGFAAWAKDYVLLCHITTRVEGDPHQDLLQEKGGTGFPYLVYLDAEGNVLGRHQGERTVAGFRESGGKAREFLELKKKAEGGDKAAGFDCLIARMEMGLVEEDEIERKVQALGELTPEQHARLDPLLVDARVRGILKGMNPKDQKAVLDVGKRFLEMKQAGKVPSGEKESLSFWNITLAHAERERDAATYEEALEALKRRFGSSPRNKAFFDKAEKKLQEMKAGGDPGAPAPEAAP